MGRFEVMSDLRSRRFIEIERVGVGYYDHHGHGSPVRDGIIQDLLNAPLGHPVIDGVTITVIQKQHRVRLFGIGIVARRGIDEQRPSDAEYL